MDLFSSVGKVKYARWAEKDPKTYAIIEFCERKSVSDAFRSQGAEFQGSFLNVYHSTVKPEARSDEAAQRKIEEAMAIVKETQSIISAAIVPVIGMLAKDKSRRSRSRSRSRERQRSRSRSRRRSRSGTRSKRSRSKSRRRSRSRSRRPHSRKRSRSRSRSKSRSRSRSKRSHSRERHSKRSRCHHRSGSRSRRSRSRGERSRSRGERSRSRGERSRSRERKISYRNKEKKRRPRSRSKTRSTSRGCMSHSKDTKLCSLKRRFRSTESKKLKKTHKPIVRDCDAEENIGQSGEEGEVIEGSHQVLRNPII